MELSGSEFTRGIENIPKSCIEDGDLPSFELLQARVAFVCAYLNLDATFSDDVVRLIDQALKVRLLYVYISLEPFEKCADTNFKKTFKQ